LFLLLVKCGRGKYYYQLSKIVTFIYISKYRDGDSMWFIIPIIIGMIYYLIYLVIPDNLSGFFGFYILQPLLWIFLSIFVYIISKREGLNIWNFKKIRKWEIGNTPFQAGLLIGGFQISLLIIIGLFIGFGFSPYSHTPLFILVNAVYIFSVIFGIELSRAYLIKKSSYRKRNLTQYLILVTIFFMFISIPFAQFSNINIYQPSSIFKFIGEYIIPGLAISLFASYLAYFGGALSAIGYMGVLQGFQWFSPYLPAVEWVHIAFIGTIGPAIGFLIIQNSIQTRQGKKIIKRKKMKDPTLSWMAISIVCVLLIFFSFGYFGTQPTIIYSGSMRPEIEVGDVVLVTDIDIEKIKVGDIIQFENEGIDLPIIHRVYEIQNEDNNLIFITKGDNNNNPDSDPVNPEQIMGKVIFNIPKIGWISITIKDFVNMLGV